MVFRSCYCRALSSCSRGPIAVLCCGRCISYEYEILIRRVSIHPSFSANRRPSFGRFSAPRSLEPAGFIFHEVHGEELDQHEVSQVSSIQGNLRPAAVRTVPPAAPAVLVRFVLSAIHRTTCAIATTVQREPPADSLEVQRLPLPVADAHV